MFMTDIILESGNITGPEDLLILIKNVSEEGLINQNGGSSKRRNIELQFLRNIFRCVIIC